MRCLVESCLQLKMSMEKPIDKEKEITTVDHDKGLGELHKRMEEYVKVDGTGRRKLSDEEFGREVVELKERLSVINMFLQDMESKD